MPKKLEQALKRVAKKKGFTGKKADHFVFGTMNNMGMMHGNKITAKGKEAEKKEKKSKKRRPTFRHVNEAMKDRD